MLSQTEKKLTKIKPRFDPKEEVWGQEQDIGTNFFKWHLLQEANVASELVRVMREQKKEVLKRFDETIDKIALKSLSDDFHSKRVVVKKTLVEDGRNISNTTIPSLFYRRKIPVAFRPYFEKAKKKKQKPLVYIIDPLDAEEIAEILDENQKIAAKAGGQQVLYEFGVQAKFNMVNQSMIEWGKAYNLVLAERVTTALAENIKFEILDGLQNFEGIPEIRKRINTQFNEPITVKVPALTDIDGNIKRKAYEYQIPPERWATMVARSETIRWSANGKVEAYKQAGVVDALIFTATGDHRTCQDCAVLDGTEFALDRAENVIPIHCQGRCTWTPKVKEEWTKDDEKLAEQIAENIEEYYR